MTGEDAASFLQGQFTQDLRGLPRMPAAYGLWLTVKGKVLADSFVLRDPAGSGFWIGSYFSPADVIRERLESHVIADDVVLEDVTADWAGITLLNSDQAGLLAPATGSATGLVFPGRRDRGPSLECVHRTAAGEPAWIASAAAAAGTIDADDIARRRIDAGIPAIPADAGPADLPNEAGLDADAISYTKGCYLGQEVMARLKSMGKVRRRLLRVRGSGEDIPPLPAAVFAGTRSVGELRSAVRDGQGGWIGLAMVSILHVAAGAKLAFGPGAAPLIELLDTP